MIAETHNDSERSMDENHNPETKEVDSNPQADAGLLDHFFHSINQEGKVEWQGYVIGNPEPGWYLVQLFEWFCGEPNVQRLMRIQEMKNWLFYDSAEAMCYSYEHGVARHGGKYRP